MKNIWILIICLAITGSILADSAKSKNSENPPVETTSISGTVTDFVSGEPLTGVEVSIEGSDVKAYTDLDGNFMIKDVKPGKYNLIFSYISYNKSLVEDMEVSEKKNEIDIKLESN
ncbi:MAG: carboxypeptidase-like regulatory domain-containing protein [Bacteroidales bacterium]|nr:carboxypeptidase-like regulatory domain-containing protein [Bacteroidales bacterium]